MPYHLVQSGAKWCVHKGGDIGQDMGEVPGGCHPTREKAVAHMRALYANVPEAQQAIRLDDEERTVIVADTPSARVRGLGNLEELTTADGMLFSYEDDVLYPFTASQMKFTVMMAFYDKNGMLLEHYLVQPGVPAVFPTQRYRYVLEMPENKFVPGRLRFT